MLINMKGPTIRLPAPCTKERELIQLLNLKKVHFCFLKVTGKLNKIAPFFNLCYSHSGTLNYCFCVFMLKISFGMVSPPLIHRIFQSLFVSARMHVCALYLRCFKSTIFHSFLWAVQGCKQPTKGKKAPRSNLIAVGWKGEGGNHIVIFVLFCNCF